MPSANDLSKERIQELLSRINELNDARSEKERRKSLLNAFLNLALIPDKDYVAINTTRGETLMTVYEEILLWD